MTIRPCSRSGLFGKSWIFAIEDLCGEPTRNRDEIWNHDGKTGSPATSLVKLRNGLLSARLRQNALSRKLLHISGTLNRGIRVEFGVDGFAHLAAHRADDDREPYFHLIEPRWRKNQRAPVSEASIIRLASAARILGLKGFVR